MWFYPAHTISNECQTESNIIKHNQMFQMFIIIRTKEIPISTTNTEQQIIPLWSGTTRGTQKSFYGYDLHIYLHNVSGVGSKLYSLNDALAPRYILHIHLTERNKNAAFVPHFGTSHLHKVHSLLTWTLNNANLLREHFDLIASFTTIKRLHKH